MKPMTPIKKAGEVAISRVLVERIEVLLGLRGDPSQHAVRGGGYESLSKIGKVAIKRATEAQQTATAALVNYTDIVNDVQAALTAKDAAIEAAQTDATAAIQNANTVAGRVDQVVALNGAGFPGTKFATFLNQLSIQANGSSGTVTAQGSAIASVQGTVDALYKIEVKSGTGGARLQLIAPGGGASVAQLEADFINLKGKVSADSMLVGLGGNLLNNTDYKQGLSGWAMARTGGMATNSTDGLRNPTLSYAGSNYPTLFLRQPGSNTATDGFLEWRAVNLTADRVESFQTVPVTPSAWYEISANMATIRGNARLGGYWYDADGNGLGGFSASHGSLGVGTGVNNNPDSWPRKATFRQAPSNAAYLMPLFRLDVTDGSAFDKWLFIHKPMVCEATAFSTTPSPYSNGVTTLIDGTGLYADSITADKMVADTITAASGIIADAAIATAKIQNLAVTNAKIANLAVDTAQIASLAVTNAKIDSLAVTSAKIADLAVSTAKVQNAAIDTLQIRGAAVTGVNAGVMPSNKTISNDSWNDLVSVNLNISSEFNTHVIAYADYSPANSTGTSDYSSFEFRLLAGSTVLAYAQMSDDPTNNGGSNQSARVYRVNGGFYVTSQVDTNGGSGTRSYKLQARHLGGPNRGLFEANLRAQEVKR